MAKLRIARAAHMQLAEIETFFEIKNPQAGNKILLAIEDAILAVADDPERFPTWHFDPIARFSVVTDYPRYAIVFDFDDEFIDILAVWDCRQDPDRLVDMITRT